MIGFGHREAPEGLETVGGEGGSDIYATAVWVKLHTVRDANDWKPQSGKTPSTCLESAATGPCTFPLGLGADRASVLAAPRVPRRPCLFPSSCLLLCKQDLN